MADVAYACHLIGNDGAPHLSTNDRGDILRHKAEVPGNTLGIHVVSIMFIGPDGEFTGGHMMHLGSVTEEVLEMSFHDLERSLIRRERE